MMHYVLMICLASSWNGCGHSHRTKFEDRATCESHKEAALDGISKDGKNSVYCRPADEWDEKLPLIKNEEQQP